MSIDNWQFMREPQNPEIQELRKRGEAVYNPDFLDKVSDDFPKKAWSL